MVALTDMVDLDVRDGIAVLLVDNPPVNALSRGVRDGLYEGLVQARDDDGVRAIVLACRGRTFIAGADIKEFGRKPEGRGLFETQDAIEDCPKPMVAAIHGTALGGGLEVALCCHFRVGLPDAKYGLPEVNLGLLPGAGGTQRLPRVVGARRALEMMTSGSSLDSREALATGLIDAIVEDDVVAGGVAFAKQVVAEGRATSRVRDLPVGAEDPSLFDDFRRTIARKTRGFDAPEAIVQCVQAAVSMAFDDGIAFEREQFGKLVRGPQSAAQRYYFFAERQTNKIPDVPRDTPRRPIAKVGVVGAGTMGGGIAMSFANAGIPVTIVETKSAALERGLGVVRKNYERSASRGSIAPEQVEERLARIDGTLDLQALADCDLVIEAIFENLDLKREVFGKLDTTCKPGAILASNTSALDVNQIAAATNRPEDVIGLHFFSPANVMKLIEVVRGDATADDVIATSMALGKAIGKVTVLVGVCRGFVGNRMLFARTAQSNKLILQGALPWDVDRVLYDFGFPMGPFAMSDLAGLDIGWSAETSKGETLRDRLCEMGRYGQKNGAGWYNYDPETRERTPEPKVAELIRTYAAEKGIALREVGDDEILNRCLFPMVNEGAKILEEKIAIRPGDIDVIWVNGYGWPLYRGGPMYWADQVGLGGVVEGMKAFAAQDGDEAFWRPSPLLARLAAEGGRFADL